MTDHPSPSVTLHHGDALAVMRSLPDASVHAVVTDPPYGLADFAPTSITSAITAWFSGDRENVPDGRGFMRCEWDRFVPPPAVWDECLRVLRPGGHMLAFAAPRTADLMGLSIRLGGFEIRDSIHWLYGGGMPKGAGVGRSVDKMAGADREVLGPYRSPDGASIRRGSSSIYAQDAWTKAQAGKMKMRTAPATPEAARWEGWFTALSPAHEPIILARKPLSGTIAATVLDHGTGALHVDACRVSEKGRRATEPGSESGSRWPANLLLGHQPTCTERCAEDCPVDEVGESARFFPTFRYEAKAGRSERPVVDGVSHPTVKPLALVRWLVRLVTPPDGIVLDPFAGSGTTLVAARNEGFHSIGVEAHGPYVAVARQRLDEPHVVPLFPLDS